MTADVLRSRARVLVVAGLILLAPPRWVLGAESGTEAVQEDRVVAGGPGEFMEVRNVVLKGSNAAIGRALATIAKQRLHVQPLPSSDAFRTRVQRRYIEKNYPILLDRMRGVAEAFGTRLEDDARNFSWLNYTEIRASCSVMYLPPGLTASGNGIFSRDYDFTTGTLRGTPPAHGELGCTARPYVIEMYPDRGYPSISVYSYDLLSGVLDGMNSEGLTVALLADDGLMAHYRMEPAGDSAVGLGVLQVLRLLLDTCADVAQAKETLLLTKQYYELIPVHYIIADRHGNAFVWEYSHSHNKEYIVENPGKALITTNFSLHEHLQGNRPPSAEQARGVCSRYCALAERIASAPEKPSVDFIKKTHSLVDAHTPSRPGVPRGALRTLWHALYFPQQRQVQISFYLHDEPDRDHPNSTRIVRSDYIPFALKPGRSVKASAGTHP